MKSNRLAVLFLLLAMFVLVGCSSSQGSKEDEKMEKDKKVKVNEPVETDQQAIKITEKHQTPPTPEPVAPLEVIEWTGKKSDQWKEYDKLVDEQKFEAASTFVEKMMAQFKEDKNSEEWVRCLINYVQLRMALHGYETAVRFLKENEWPTDLLGSSVLHLYYSYSLVNYAQMYSWEIRQRERIDTKGVVDLKAWTNEQIYEEAHKTFNEVWKHREQLGNQPIKILNEYISANNYPRNIRGTLRDSLTYQWTSFLLNTSSWRPEHSNQIFKLNLAELIEGNHADLLDPEEHPLRKLSTILYDLEKWHSERGEKEAAFEARMTRLIHLHSNFTQSSDKMLIQKDLKEQLEGVRELPWWSLGMAQLATFIKAESAHDNMIRAHAVAKEGMEAYPDSVGGQRCRNIVQSIEQPSYDVQGMAIDAPAKDSILVNYKNLTKIYFRAYRVNLKKHIESANDYNIYPDYNDYEKILKKKPDFTWSTDLPETIDYKNHHKLITHPMKESGFYAVVSSAKKNFEQEDNVIRGVNMIVGDLTIVTRYGGSDAEVQILSGSTGKPVSGVTVYMYKYDYHRGHHKVSERKTGETGVVKFQGHDYDSYFIFAKKGKQVALNANSIYFHGESQSYTTQASLIYTDRSIYRPNQKLHFKVVAYQGEHRKANFKTSPDTSMTVTLRDANYQEVGKVDLKTNKFGTASGEFLIPSGRLLGHWRLECSYSGSAAIKVEEYKRPTFETKIRDSETPLRLNKPAKLVGEVKYYFGLPVTNGKVAWKVTRSPIYPWWWSYYWWYGGSTNSQTQTISTGTGSLNDEGLFDVEFTPEADERLSEDSKGLTYRYTLSAEVTDEGGETRTATKSFRLGFVAVEASFSSDTNFFLEGQKQSFSLFRTNLDGSPLAGDAQYRVVSLVSPEKTLLPVEQPRMQPSTKQEGFFTPDDGKRIRWSPNYVPEVVLRTWKDGAEVAKGELKHGENGKVEVMLPDSLPGGVYRLHYTTKDAFGAEYEMSKEFMVAGPTTQLSLPSYLKVETNSVKVGGTVRVFTGSGLEDQLLFMDIYRNGKRTERRNLESGTRSKTLIEIPVTEELRGGFSIAVFGLRDFQFMQFSEHIYVPWDNKELKIEFSTFRDRLRPGQEETWSVKITGPSGKDTPVKAAEVLAYMYDRSLDTFAPHNPPNPSSLFPSFVGIQWPQISIGIASLTYLSSHGFNSPVGWGYLNGDSLNFFSGYGIGGLGVRGSHFGEMSVMNAPQSVRSPKNGERLESKEEMVMEKDSGEMAPPPVQPSEEPALTQGQSVTKKPPTKHVEEKPVELRTIALR